MNFKQKYKSIERGYKNEVWRLSGTNKTTAFRWMNDKYISAAMRIELETASNDVYEGQKVIGGLTVRFGKRIFANNSHVWQSISYRGLMDFKLKVERKPNIVPSIRAIRDLLTDARKVIESLHKENPYQMKLLIAKFLLHDQENN